MAAGTYGAGLYGDSVYGAGGGVATVEPQSIASQEAFGVPTVGANIPPEPPSPTSVQADAIGDGNVHNVTVNDFAETGLTASEAETHRLYVSDRTP